MDQSTSVFASVLRQALNTLQNLTEKLKSTLSRAECESSVGVYNSRERCIKTITKPIIKLRLLDPRAPRADPVEKNSGLENTCAPHQRERSILSPKDFKLEPRGLLTL